MKQAGQIVLFRFPRADLEGGKLRPALLLGKLPGDYDDWLICMISSQTRHFVQEFDEIVRDNDPDFAESGLKVVSVIRIGRLAVAQGEILLGAIGQIAPRDFNASRGAWQNGLRSHKARRPLAGRAKAQLHPARQPMRHGRIGYSVRYGPRMRLNP